VGNPATKRNIVNYRHFVKHKIPPKSGIFLASKLDNLSHSVDNLSDTISLVSSQIAHNVPAVYDVFLRPIRKNAKHFYGRKKMWRNKNAQRAQARLRFCVARAAEGGEAYTDLLGEVRAYTIFFI